MRTIVWVVFGVIFVCVLFGAFGFVANATPLLNSPDYPWLSGSAQVISQAPTGSSSEAAFCSGVDQTIQLEKRDYTDTACVYGGSTDIRVATYINGQGYSLLAVAMPYETVFHELRGVCVGKQRCTYAAKTDTLITPYGAAYGVSTAAFYAHFSKALVRSTDLNTLATYYTFEPTTEPVLVKQRGSPAMVGAIAVSQNGRWALIEVYSYGFLRVDLTNLTMRRVVAPSADYGYGNDPGYEVAISNSGHQIAITGFRAGLDVYEVDSDCGDYLNDTSDKTFGRQVTPCPSGSIATYSLFSSFQYAKRPSFDASGTRLHVTIVSNDGVRRHAVLSPSTASAVAPVAYLALGDSFSSGEGEIDDAFYKKTANNTVDSCHVSARAYSSLVAHTWGLGTGGNVACSGAVTADVYGVTDYMGQGDRLKTRVSSADERRTIKTQSLSELQPGVVRQLDFVTEYTPGLVFIGIGGNDAGLMSKLKACVGFDTCEWAENAEKRLATANEIKEVYLKLREVVKSIYAASPQSRVVVVGYPRVINEATSASCGVLLGTLLNPKERQFMDESIKYLNSLLEAAATSEGASFASIEDAFLGHRLCDQKQDAMNGIRWGDDVAPIAKLPLLKLIGAESFHPTPAGHVLSAAAIQKAYPVAPQGYCAYCAQEKPAPLPSSYWVQGVALNTTLPRQIAATMVEPVVYRPGQQLSITSPLSFGSAVPNAHVTVELHSEPSVLAVPTVGNDGSVNTVVTIPDGLSEGYHSLHMYGTLVTGELVDVYQIIAVQVYDDGAPGATAQSSSSADIASGGVTNLDAGLALSSHGYNGGNSRLWGASKPTSSQVTQPAEGSVLGVFDKQAYGNAVLLLLVGAAAGAFIIVLLALLWKSLKLFKKRYKPKLQV
jgi:lysophospholipase L1-like esterase